MTGLVLVGLLPFAALGIFLGHSLTPDRWGRLSVSSAASLLCSVGPGSRSVLRARFYDVTKLLPSYWLVQAGRAGLTHQAWPVEGWVVILVWTAGLTALAVMAYRRDTGKA